MELSKEYRRQEYLYRKGFKQWSKYIDQLIDNNYNNYIKLCKIEDPYFRSVKRYKICA